MACLNPWSRRRRGLRKRAHQVPTTFPVSQSIPVKNREVDQSELPITTNNDPPQLQSQTSFWGYLAEESFLSNSCAPELSMSESEPMEIASTCDKILQATDATTLPPPPLIDAFVDVYFTYVFPMVPVVDRCDLTVQPQSTLLLQTLCLIGSHFRQPQKSISSAHHFYRKVKTLLDVNYEKDSLTTLKSLCLIGCRSAGLPTNISMDSSWHWAGVATRYLYSMGLHREATYTARSNAGISRRIWWHLFVCIPFSLSCPSKSNLFQNQDKLQSLCYGRPPAIRLHEIDVKLLTLEDFSTPHPDNEVLIQRTKLCIILGKVSDAQYGRQMKPFLEEATNIGEYLKKWINGLPPNLHLYDELGARRPYHRPVSELHIMYFTGIILFYRLVGNSRLGLTPLKMSVVAASCIARLFEETYYRNEIISLLPINNWYCTVASVALIHALKRFPEDGAVRRQELEILSLVLQGMVINTPSSNLILRNIDRIQSLTLEQDPTTRPLRVTQDPALGSDAASLVHFRGTDPLALFPFPGDICPCMKMLRTTAGEIHGNDDAGVASPGCFEDISDLTFNFDFCDVQLDGSVLPFEDDMPFEDDLPFDGILEPR